VVFQKNTVSILNLYGYHFTTYNVNKDPAYKEAIKRHSDWPTFPQLFINGELIGGHDILLNLHRENKLQKIIENSEALKK